MILDNVFPQAVLTAAESDAREYCCVRRRRAFSPFNCLSWAMEKLVGCIFPLVIFQFSCLDLGEHSYRYQCHVPLKQLLQDIRCSRATCLDWFRLVGHMHCSSQALGWPYFVSKSRTVSWVVGHMHCSSQSLGWPYFVSKSRTVSWVVGHMHCSSQSLGWPYFVSKSRTVSWVVGHMHCSSQSLGWPYFVSKSRTVSCVGGVFDGVNCA